MLVPKVTDAPTTVASANAPAAGVADGGTGAGVAFLGLCLAFGLPVAMFLLVRSRRRSRGRLVPVTEEYLDEDKVLAALGFETPQATRGTKGRGRSKKGLEAFESNRNLD